MTAALPDTGPLGGPGQRLMRSDQDGQPMLQPNRRPTDHDFRVHHQPTRRPEGAAMSSPLPMSDDYYEPPRHSGEKCGMETCPYWSGSGHVCNCVVLNFEGGTPLPAPRVDADTPKEAGRCNEKHPTNDSVIPCCLPTGHSGPHWSTTGCAGSEINWSARSAGTPTPDLEAIIEAAAKGEYDYDRDSGPPVWEDATAGARRGYLDGMRAAFAAAGVPALIAEVDRLRQRLDNVDPEADTVIISADGWQELQRLRAQRLAALAAIRRIPRRTGTPEWSKPREVGQATGFDMGLAAAEDAVLAALGATE